MDVIYKHTKKTGLYRQIQISSFLYGRRHVVVYLAADYIAASSVSGLFITGDKLPVFVCLSCDLPACPVHPDRRSDPLSSSVTLHKSGMAHPVQGVAQV